MFTSLATDVMSEKYEYQTRLAGLIWDIDTDFVNFKTDVCILNKQFPNIASETALCLTFHLTKQIAEHLG